MPATIPDLWPNDLAVANVLTPLAIMRYQAGQLLQKTKGLLEAEVESGSNKERTIHAFEIVAPALGRYRYRLFTASHRPDLVYPVRVNAPFQFVYGRASVSEIDVPSQDELFSAIGAILNATQARSVIQSLIAQSNETSQNTPDTQEA